jgi:hypothetical protein
MGLMTHQSKRGYARWRAEVSRQHAQSAKHAEEREAEIQRRVALELWKRARLEEESNG